MQNPLEPLVQMIADAVVARLKQSEGPRLLSVKQASRYIALSERTVRQAIAERRIPTVRDGRRVLLDRAALDKWIDQRTAVG